MGHLSSLSSFRSASSLDIFRGEIDSEVFRSARRVLQRITSECFKVFKFKFRSSRTIICTFAAHLVVLGRRNLLVPAELHGEQLGCHSSIEVDSVAESAPGAPIDCEDGCRTPAVLSRHFDPHFSQKRQSLRTSLLTALNCSLALILLLLPRP